MSEDIRKHSPKEYTLNWNLYSCIRLLLRTNNVEIIARLKEKRFPDRKHSFGRREHEHSVGMTEGQGGQGRQGAVWEEDGVLAMKGL